MDISIAKVKITPEMVGKTCLLPVNDYSLAEINKVPFGEFQNADIREIKDSQKRSYLQLGLYWAACKELAENANDTQPDYKNWNTSNKVDEQIKIDTKHYLFYIHYMNKFTGVETLHIKTRSISFSELKHLEGCGYFTDAFEIMANRVKMPVDNFLEHVKSKMGKDFVCHSCGHVYVRGDRQNHHKFSNTKINKEIYHEFINHPENIQLVCSGCNVSHAGQAKKEGQVGLICWTEKDFCDNFGIDVRTAGKVESIFNGEDNE